MWVIDSFSPLLVSGKQGNMKCYISPFMCASLLAVHLELVKSLEVVAFIRAFRRCFCARRGPSGTLLSDSAKTFKSVAQDIKKTIKFTFHKVFTSEFSPLQGGIWER